MCLLSKTLCDLTTLLAWADDDDAAGLQQGDCSEPAHQWAGLA